MGTTESCKDSKGDVVKEVDEFLADVRSILLDSGVTGKSIKKSVMIIISEASGTYVDEKAQQHIKVSGRARFYIHPAHLQNIHAVFNHTLTQIKSGFDTNKNNSTKLVN